MSKERELLKRCEIAIIEGEDYLVGLLGDIQELLAQPEPTKQELILEWYKKGYKQGFVDGQDVTDNMILGEDDES